METYQRGDGRTCQQAGGAFMKIKKQNGLSINVIDKS